MFFSRADTICDEKHEQRIDVKFLVKLKKTPTECYVETNDVETKRQSMHWKTPASPRMKKARMSKSKFKAMLIVFFDINGIVMTEWVPEGQTVNQTYY